MRCEHLMEIKVKAFPKVFINTICTEHDCSVEVDVAKVQKFNTTQTIASTFTTMRCLIGGPASETNCAGNWELQILAGGEVTIGP